MSRYIALLKFTAQGAKSLAQSTHRAHSFDRLAKKAGVKVEGQYWTMGRFDGVLVLKCDQEEKVLRLLTRLAALGYVRSETMRAFNDTEFDGLVRG